MVTRIWVDSVGFRKQPDELNWWIYINHLHVGEYRQVERVISDKVVVTYDLMWNYEAVERNFGLWTTLFLNDLRRRYLPRLYGLTQRPDWWMVMYAFVDQDFCRAQGLCREYIYGYV